MYERIQNACIECSKKLDQVSALMRVVNNAKISQGERVIAGRSLIQVRVEAIYDLDGLRNLAVMQEVPPEPDPWGLTGTVATVEDLTTKLRYGTAAISDVETAAVMLLQFRTTYANASADILERRSKSS